MDFGVNNGTRFVEPETASEADDALSKPMTLSYRSNVPAFNLWDRGGAGTSFIGSMLFDIPRMLVHPIVRNALSYYCGGISSVKFTVEASSSKIGEFAHANFQRFWERSLAQCQHVYRFGWCGFEVNYRTEGGFRHFDSLHDFFPYDVWAVTKRDHYAGVAVQNVHRLGLGVPGTGMGGNVLLWGPKRWPAKGFWLSHQREYDRFYGMTQLYGAWAPWRRLAARDGAEEVEDGAAYRAGYQGPMGRFPAKGYKKKGGFSTYDEARELMREMVENAKAGLSVAMPGTLDENKNYEWDLTFPTSVLDVSPLTNRCESLEKKIQIGMGVPPELIEASETGSGYSGRRIPLQGFYTTQLGNARNLVHAFQWQICDPLIRWNFGPGHKVTVKVSLVTPELLEQKQQESGGEEEPGQQESRGKGSEGWQPFTGKRGGHGQKNQSTGAVRYLSTVDGGRTLSTDTEGVVWRSAIDGNAITLAVDAEGHKHAADSGQFVSKEESAGGKSDVGQRLKDTYEKYEAMLRPGAPKTKKAEREAAKKEYYDTLKEHRAQEEVNKGKKPASKAALTGTEETAHTVVGIVHALGKEHNFASIVDVRAALTKAGITERTAQDAALWDARKAGLVTMSGIEGRGGITPEQQRDALREDDAVLGHLSLKGAGLEVAKSSAVAQKAASAASAKPQATIKPEQHTHTVADIVQNVGGSHNFADIVQVRAEMAKAGIKTLGDQDAVLNHARRAGLITASGSEGRHGVTAEQQRAGIREGDGLLAYLSLKDAGKDLLKGPRSLSLANEGDELASDPAEQLLRLILGQIDAFTTEQRTALLAAFDQATLAGSFDAARTILEQQNPALIGLLVDAQLAAILTAMQRLASRTTEELPEAQVFDPLPPWRGNDPPLATAEEQPEGNPLWPMIDAATADLRTRRLLTSEQFHEAVASARAKAFTVAHVESEATLEQIRTALADTVADGGTLREFKAKVRQTDEGSLLAPNHVETVFRTNINEAYSRGQEKLLEHSVIGELFPFARYDAIRDGRVRPEHVAMEKAGLQGTNIFFRADPVFQIFRPPWGFSCRCSWTAISVEDAADAGIKEAMEALRTGNPPVPHFVPMPPFRPDPKFARELSTDKEGHDHNEKGKDGGQFTAKSGAVPPGTPEENQPKKPEWAEEAARGRAPEEQSADELHDKADKIADGVLAKFKHGMAAITSVPVLRQLKQLGDFCKQTTAKLYKALEGRYGRATAISCLAFGQTVDLGTMGIGAALGIPLYVPGLSLIGALPAVALAEAYKQLRGPKTLGTVDMDVVEQFGRMLALMEVEPDPPKPDATAEAMTRLAASMATLAERKPEPAITHVHVAGPVVTLPPMTLNTPITVQPSPPAAVTMNTPITVQVPAPGKMREVTTVSRDLNDEITGSVKTIEPLKDEPDAK